jgi:hypothetical protein
MDQASLFFESWEEALQDDVRGLGGYKEVGRLLFPEILDTAAAGRTLADKLNSNRRERLSDKQERLIIRLAAQKRGYSAALAFLCDDTSHERTKPLNPLDETAELQRQYIASVQLQAKLAERMERLTRAPLPQVK